MLKITDYLAAGLVTVVVGYLGNVTLRIYNLRRKYAHIPGPPANGLVGFFLGNFLDVIYNESVRKRVTNDLVLDWFDQKFSRNI